MAVLCVLEYDEAETALVLGATDQNDRVIVEVGLRLLALAPLLNLDETGTWL